MRPKISVIIPAFNEEDYIGACLNSILNQDLPKSAYEIILANNNSTDRTTQIAQLKGVKIVNEAQKGVVPASIAGAKSAKAPLLAFVDADCRVPKNWLSSLLRHYQSENLTAAGGIFVFYDANPFLNFWVTITKPLNWHLIGGNYSIKKEAFLKYAPDFNFGFDVELTLRLKRHGKFLIDRSIEVQTSSRRYQHNLFQTLFLYLVNDFCLCHLHRPFKFDFTDIRIRNLEQRQRLIYKITHNPIIYAGALASLLIVTVAITPKISSAETLRNFEDRYKVMANAVSEKIRSYPTLENTLEKTIQKARLR